MNPPAPMLDRTRLGLNLFGVAAVGYTVTRQFLDHLFPSWILVTASVALAAWLAAALLPRPRGRAGIVVLAIMLVAGAVASSATNGLALVPAVVALAWLARDAAIPLSLAIGLGVVGLAVLPLGAIGVDISAFGILALEAGLVVAFLSGQGRRQYLRAESQLRALRDEQARADVLAARQGIAHDIHDVLAHSLGGLVIQLDAVEALLDAGETEPAKRKVRDARSLAAEGLGDARRAVDALREPTGDPTKLVDAESLLAGIAALLEAHRSIDGAVEFTERGSRRHIREPLEVALRRAVQEGLTNARKHAARSAVDIGLSWEGDLVVLQIANALTANGTDFGRIPGGGHGLRGMSERFDALPGGAARWSIDNSRFVVTVQGEVA